MLVLGSSVRVLEVRVLVHLGGTQGVSSVDRGGRRGADVRLVGELRLVLAVVERGGGQHAMPHADGHLVDDARGVGGVLDGVAGRALGRHQVGHGAGGAQGGGGGVGVEVGLAGEVGGGQVGVNVGGVGGAVVVEGVGGLGSDGGGDVGLLAPVTSITLHYHMLLGMVSPYLAEVERLLLEGVWP